VIDLPAYLARLGLPADTALPPTVATLHTLHRAHALAIPFENLDIQLGRRIALDLPALQAKLVGARRGGYCFEQNRLFAAVLEHLGFTVQPRGARVGRGPPRPAPRTHLCLEVVADGAPWLADVGFGSDSLLAPVPLVPDERAHAMGVWAYRLRRDGDLHVLASRKPDGTWLDLYAFTREPQQPVDQEVASHYTSTHPEWRCWLTWPGQRVPDDTRHTLRNREYGILRADGATRRELATPEELLAVLAEGFGLVFPAGTRFRQPSFP